MIIDLIAYFIQAKRKIHLWDLWKCFVGQNFSVKT